MNKLTAAQFLAVCSGVVDICASLRGCREDEQSKEVARLARWVPELIEAVPVRKSERLTARRADVLRQAQGLIALHQETKEQRLLCAKISYELSR